MVSLAAATVEQFVSYFIYLFILGPADVWRVPEV